LTSFVTWTIQKQIKNRSNQNKPTPISSNTLKNVSFKMIFYGSDLILDFGIFGPFFHLCSGDFSLNFLSFSLNAQGFNHKRWGYPRELNSQQPPEEEWTTIN